MEINQIDIIDYYYNLPSDRIAKYPAIERDLSKLLVYRGDQISADIFRNIGSFLPSGSLLVFNNTRVIRARILFSRMTGSTIEILCLEPLSPAEYDSSLASPGPVEWKCLIGNLKKWKSGIITKPLLYRNKSYELTAKKVRPEGEAWRISFEWGQAGISFGEVIELAGSLPLPPYLGRKAETDDLNRYQTIYSKVSGSVAAPTAGLHFTEAILERLRENGMDMAEITLHVGAGTFKPVKSGIISEHEMHSEHFFITDETIKELIKYQGRIIAVGTTSVRTLESLYWLGIKLKHDPDSINMELSIGQWDGYEYGTLATSREALETVLELMQSNNISTLNVSTGIMIVPGYKFRITDTMITNFHQPGSTLLLLVSAFVGDKWKDIYSYALANDFRFLSYGDCSLLEKPQGIS